MLFTYSYPSPSIVLTLSLLYLNILVGTHQYKVTPFQTFLTDSSTQHLIPVTSPATLPFPSSSFHMDCVILSPR